MDANTPYMLAFREHNERKAELEETTRAMYAFTQLEIALKDVLAQKAISLEPSTTQTIEALASWSGDKWEALTAAMFRQRQAMQLALGRMHDIASER